MLCPYCLCITGSGPTNGDCCLVCGRDIPASYARLASRRHAVPFPVIGLDDHGKATFLSSLILELDRSGARWKDFSHRAPEPRTLKPLTDGARMLSQGILPASSRRILHEPAILQLHNLPHLGDRQVVLLDAPAEDLQLENSRSKFMSWAAGSSCLTWLIQGSTLEDNIGLSVLRDSYLLQMERLKANSTDQDLILVVTKIDAVDRREAPEAFRHIMDGRIGREPPRRKDLSEVSTAIGQWLKSRDATRNFVRGAEESFRSVTFLGISALGSSPAVGSGRIHVAPKGVLLPLFAALALQDKSNPTPRSSLPQEQIHPADQGEVRPPVTVPVDEKSSVVTTEVLASPPEVAEADPLREVPNRLPADTRQAQSPRKRRWLPVLGIVGAALVVLILIGQFVRSGGGSNGSNGASTTGQTPAPSAFTSRTYSFGDATVSWTVPTGALPEKTKIVPFSDGLRTRRRWTLVLGPAEACIEIVDLAEGPPETYVYATDREWRTKRYKGYSRIELGEATQNGRRCLAWTFRLYDDENQWTNIRRWYYFSVGRSTVAVGFVAPADRFTQFDDQYFKGLISTLRIQ